MSSNGNLLVVGAPSDDINVGSVSFFKRNSSLGWTKSGSKITQSSSSMFGFSLAMSSTGEFLVIGASSDAYVFKLTSNGVTYTFLQTLSASGQGDSFGQSVAMTTDAKRIVVGDASLNSLTLTRQGVTFKYYRGGAFIFDLMGSSYHPVPGNVTTAFTNTTKSSADFQSSFGYTVALSDNNHFVFGAYNVPYNTGECCLVTQR